MRLISLLILALIAGYAPVCMAQSTANVDGCKIGRTAPQIGSRTWPEKTHVDVFVRVPDFSLEELPSLLTPIENWDASYLENGSGVRFKYKGTVSDVRICSGCLTIVRGRTADSRHGAELHAFSKEGNGAIDYAKIIIDPRYVIPATLTAIVVHELGHSMGLLDCFDCKRGTTAMGSFDTTLKFFNLRIANWSNEIKGPTGCDLKRVRAAYKVSKVIRAVPIAADAADEGEEPEADDTPIVP